MTTPEILKPILLLGSFIALFCVGIGPSLHLISRAPQQRLGYALCLAPAIGLIILSLLLYPLFLADRLVSSLAVGLLAFALVLSAVLTWLDYRRHCEEYRRKINVKVLSLTVLSGLVVLAMLSAPGLIGGTDYSTIQGNQNDGSNYILMARYAQVLPFSARKNARVVIEKDPTLLIGAGLMATRSAASLVLAWISSLSNVPVYDAYYPYKLLQLLVAFFATLALCWRVGMRSWYPFATAMIIAVGFMAAYLVHSDALSQLIAVPLLLVFLFSWVQLEQAPSEKTFSRERLMFGLSLAGLINYYTELWFVLILMIAIYYALQMLRDPLWTQRKTILNLIFTGIIVIILLLPVIPTTFIFAQKQGVFAVTDVSNKWASYFFHFLYYQDTLSTGLWGLHFLRFIPSQTLEFNAARFLVTTVLGLCLTIMLGLGLIWSFSRRNNAYPEAKIFSAGVITFWGSGLVLYLIDRPWISGKAMTMGYPLATVALVYFVWRFVSSAQPNKIISVLVRTVLFVWFLLQLTVPGLLISAATSFMIQPAGYLEIKIDEYSQLKQFLASLRQYPPKLLATEMGAMPPIRGISWINILATNTPLLSLPGAALYYDRLPTIWQESNTIPDKLLIAKNNDYMATYGLGIQLLSSPLLALYATTPTDWDRAVLNSNIFLPDNQHSALTLQNADSPIQSQATSQPDISRRFVQDSSSVPGIRFVASGQMPLGLSLDYTTDYNGRVDVSLNGKLIHRMIAVSNVPQQAVMCLRPKPGTNQLYFNNIAPEPAKENLIFREMRFLSANRLDVGTLVDGNSIGSGWYTQETINQDTKFHWAGKVATFSLLTCSPESSGYTLKFKAFSLEYLNNSQKVTVTINDTIIGTVAIQSNWHEYEITIPAGVIQPGTLASIKLDHALATKPANDSRELSVAYSWFSLIPQPRTTLTTF